MCVILVKPKGIEMPPKRELMLAASTNPHGFGFVSSNGLYKRTMSFVEFYEALKGVGKDDACIMHLRIATHGSHKVSNCHPFKEGDIYFAHNGVLRVPVKGDKTDSETEFDTVLYPAAKKYGLDSPMFNLIVKQEIGWSKFAFMQNGHIWLFGRFIEQNGLYYSNLNHQHYYAY